MSDSDDHTLTAGQRWIVAGFLAFMLALFAYDVATDYVPEKFSVFLFIVFWIILLPVHELGHAAAAWAFGWCVEQVVVGFGRTLARFRWRETEFELRLFPLEGFARMLPRSGKLLRPQAILISLAGVAAEVLCLLAALLLLGPARLLEASTEAPVIAVQTLALVVGLAAFLNLIPHGVATDRGRIANDGLMAWLLLTAGADELRQWFKLPDEPTSGT